MELYDEDYYQKSKKKSKLPIIIGVIIAILIVFTIAIIYVIMYLESTVMKIKVDNQNMSEIEKILYITEDQSKLYIPIRGIASYLGYSAFKGDYQNISEDTSKCHVKNENETAMFTLNSSTLIKVRGDSDYEYIALEEEVFEKDGDLYTTIDGIEKAFNVEFVYNAENRKIDIYTMEYLVNYCTTNLQIENYKESFNNKKAIFEDMLIINQDRQYGVINAATGEAVLETKYDSISYLSETKDFLVGNNNKYGIVSKDQEIKVKIAYDEIKIIDDQSSLYLIKESKRYGVIDINGKVVIPPEYEKIGIDPSKFIQNGLENPYVLLGKLIPVQNNGLWGFFNLQGEQISDFKYTEIGCSSSKVANSYPLINIPSFEIVIVGIDKKYNLMNSTGKELIDGFLLDTLYMKTDASSGQNTFYMTYGEKTDNITEWLERMGIKTDKQI